MKHHPGFIGWQVYTQCDGLINRHETDSMNTHAVSELAWKAEHAGHERVEVARIGHKQAVFQGLCDTCGPQVIRVIPWLKDHVEA